MKKEDVYILTVDDDIEFNLLLEKKFKKQGLRLKTSSTIKEFSEKLKEERPSLCLIDVNLEESISAGFTLIRALRKSIGNEIPIFIFSARDGKEDIINALSIGANDYITKPLDFDFLLAKITRYLGITDIETREYPYIVVPTKNERCTLSTEFELHSLSEFNITLRSTNYISKGTLVRIDFMNQIVTTPHFKTLDVSNIWRDDKTGLFYITLDFNSDDKELLQDVRKWLTTKKLVAAPEAPETKE